MLTSETMPEAVDVQGQACQLTDPRGEDQHQRVDHQSEQTEGQDVERNSKDSHHRLDDGVHQAEDQPQHDVGQERVGESPFGVASTPLTTIVATQMASALIPTRVAMLVTVPSVGELGSGLPGQQAGGSSE